MQDAKMFGIQAQEQNGNTEMQPQGDRQMNRQTRNNRSRRAAGWLAAVCTATVLGTQAMAGTVSVTRNVPDAILSTASTFQATLTVAITDAAPNGLIVTEQLPAGWTITGATWEGQAFVPVLLGGTYKWLFEGATGSGKTVGNGTLTFTVNTNGAGANNYTFAGSAKRIDSGTETSLATTGHTAMDIFPPATVTTVAVTGGRTVDVTFSAAMSASVLTATNYTVSGTGMGALTPNPSSVALKTGNTYTLTWNAGEMFNGGTITITVANAIDGHGLPLGAPNAASHTNGAVGTPPTATIGYSTATATNADVVATLQPSEHVTVTNNAGSLTKTFSANGTFTFEFQDDAGNTATQAATVTWIDKTAPTVTARTPAPNATIATPAVNIDITFDEAVAGVDTTDLVLSGTSAGSATVDSVTKTSGNTWRFAISGLTPGSGTLTVTLAPDAGDIKDAVGNDLASLAWSYTVLIPIYHPFDANHDWVIGTTEMQAMKAAWAAGSLTGGYDQDYYVLWTVDLWKAGAYHNDFQKTGYKIWQAGEN